MASVCRSALMAGSRILVARSKTVTQKFLKVRPTKTSSPFASLPRYIPRASRVLSALGSVETKIPLHSTVASASSIDDDSSYWRWISQVAMEIRPDGLKGLLEDSPSTTILHRKRPFFFQEFASCNVNVMKKADSLKEVSKWEDLNRDLLGFIFDKLDVIDVTKGASRVCISWFLASHDKTLWQTVDLTKLQVDVSCSIESTDKVRPLVFYKTPFNDEYLSLKDLLIKIIKFLFDLDRGLRLKNLLIEIVNLSRTAPENLLFNFFSYVQEDDLMFAAKSQWTNLKTLIVAHDHRVTGTFDFQAVGENCNNLTNLKYLGYLEKDIAEKIVRYLKNLKRLSLRCSVASNTGVLSLITGLQNLKILNLSHCKDSDMFPDTVHKYILLQAAKKKVDKFIVCSQDCRTCEFLSNFSWSYCSKHWQNDEIEEFEF